MLLWLELHGKISRWRTSKILLQVWRSIAGGYVRPASVGKYLAKAVTEILPVVEKTIAQHLTN
jgi:hypothetical protein